MFYALFTYVVGTRMSDFVWYVNTSEMNANFYKRVFVFYHEMRSFKPFLRYICRLQSSIIKSSNKIV